MFRLHDSTRRRIALAVFVALGVVPTAAVGLWSIAWQLPWYLRAEAQRLNRQLGMDVGLEGLRHPRPGVVVYEGLRLSDPETGRTVLRCGTLEATWTEAVDRQAQRRPAIVLATASVEIEAVAMDRLEQLLQRTLQGQNGRPEMELRATATEVTIRLAGGDQILTNLEGGIGILPCGLQAQAAFHLAGSASAEPVRARVVRNRQLTPPATGFELDTGGHALPCVLLATAWEELGVLGPASRLSGYVWARPTPAGWEGEWTGHLLGIDLGNLVSRHFPHELSGSADLAVQYARFRQGRLEEAIGTLAGGPGKIGQSLLDAAATYLRLDRPVLRLGTEDPLPYDRLAMTLAMDWRGLRLQGQCAEAPPGTILAARGSRLLGEPSGQPLPIAALIQALVPATQTLMPASRQSDWLARRLPAPDVGPATDAFPPESRFHGASAAKSP